MWKIEYTDEFEKWWDSLKLEEKESVGFYVELLKHHGINLKFPYSSGISDSKYNHLRELRVQHKGEPYRVLYAFDPLRSGILLIGGNKKGNDRWYKKMISIADKLYCRHIKSLNIKSE